MNEIKIKNKLELDKLSLIPIRKLSIRRLNDSRPDALIVHVRDGADLILQSKPVEIREQFEIGLLLVRTYDTELPGFVDIFSFPEDVYLRNIRTIHFPFDGEIFEVGCILQFNHYFPTIFLAGDTPGSVAIQSLGSVATDFRPEFEFSDYIIS